MTNQAKNNEKYAKAAKVAGVVCVALAKGTWWLTKALAKISVAILTRVGSVLGTVLTLLLTSGSKDRPIEASHDDEPFSIDSNENNKNWSGTYWHLDENGYNHGTKEWEGTPK